MKNNILILSLLIIFGFFNTTFGQDIFNFDVTEAEIIDDGNTFKGTKRGIATSEDGTIIHADNFEYDKLTNILKANGNVIIDDSINKAKIFTEDITYLKNEEIIFTKGRSKAIDETTSIDGDRFEYKKKLNILNARGNVIINDTLNKTKIFTEDVTYLRNKETIFTESRSTAVDEKTFIVANRFEYKKKLNILNARGNVEIINKVEDYILYTEEITYEMSQEKFVTQGYTEAIIQSKYNFKSKNVSFFKE